jgi:WYL domain
VELEGNLHREVRTFSLIRISAFTMLKETFAMSSGFDLEQYLGNAWNLMPQLGPEFHVVVRFQTLVARTVSEVN